MVSMMEKEVRVLHNYFPHMNELIWKRMFKIGEDRRKGEFCTLIILVNECVCEHAYVIFICAMYLLGVKNALPQKLLFLSI